jgi:hypothetical protein
VFSGHPDLPQDLSGALTEQLHVSLVDDPGLRVAETTGRATSTYHAADLNPQSFVRQPASPNAPEQLEMAPRAINQRQALSRTRGLPGVL